MSFLDEVESLKAKAGLSKARLPVVVGLGILALAILVLCGYLAWNAFSAPTFEVTQADSSQDNNPSEELSEPQKVYVHITGAVVNPGMYELDATARVSDAIEAAGGLRNDAVEASVNLARVVSDGEQIIVASEEDQSIANSSGSTNPHASTNASTNSASSQATIKININTASAEELMELDGVGEATAQKIIAYRTEHGSFSSIEDIKNVSGIGDKKFDAIKDAITV